MLSSFAQHLRRGDRLHSRLFVQRKQPMLDVAFRRPRSADLRVTFQKLDAQTGDLGDDLFDAAFSRFGVMFFSDAVTAFVNIRSWLKPDGRTAFVCWRAPNENPWKQAPH